MKLGVISDIHGNRIALEAVVADGRAQGVDVWWALGDLVAIGPDPIGTLEVLVDLPNVVITRGNTDRYVVTGERPSPHPHRHRRTRVRSPTTAGSVELHSRSTRDQLDDGTRLLGVHASPGLDDGDGITPHRPDDSLRAALDTADADIVIAGHTHQPTDRQVGSVRAVNGGSVSNPITDDLRASYVVIHGDRHEHRLEHRRVAYDTDAFLRSLACSGHPEHDYIASFQRGEQFRHPAQRPGAPVITD